MYPSKCEICVCMEGKWWRVAATVVEDDRIEARQHILSEYPALMQIKARALICFQGEFATKDIIGFKYYHFVCLRHVENVASNFKVIN